MWLLQLQITLLTHMLQILEHIIRVPGSTCTVPPHPLWESRQWIFFVSLCRAAQSGLPPPLLGRTNQRFLSVKSCQAEVSSHWIICWLILRHQIIMCLNKKKLRTIYRGVLGKKRCLFGALAAALSVWKWGAVWKIGIRGQFMECCATEARGALSAGADDSKVSGGKSCRPSTQGWLPQTYVQNW